MADEQVTATTTAAPASTGSESIATPTPSSNERPGTEGSNESAASSALGSGSLDRVIELALARQGIGEKPVEQVTAPVEGQAAQPEATTPTDPAALNAELEKLRGELTGYKEQVGTIDSLGGLEALKADLAFADTFTSPQFDSLAMARQMIAASKDNYINFVWSSVERHQDDIANYLLNRPEIREKALATDPGYQEYLHLKEQGFDPATYQDEQADLTTPEGQRYSALQKEHQALKAQFDKVASDIQSGRMSEAEERVFTAYKSYDDEQLKWVSDQVAGFKWGEEYQDELGMVVERVQTLFNKNATAQDALIRARHFAAQGAAGEAQKERWTKVVRNQLGQTLAKVVQPFNRMISAERKYIELTRQKQAGTINVPGAAATEQRLPGTPNKPSTERDFDARIEARMAAYANSSNAPKNTFVK